MTTPNIEELRLLAQTLEFSDAVRCSIQRAADLLQSQAERIKELEEEIGGWREDQKENIGVALQHEVNKITSERDELREKYTDTYWALNDAARENTSLRAQLTAIAATEPVAEVGGTFTLYWVGSGPIEPIVKKYGIKVGTKLFTRPMPAQRLTELKLLMLTIAYEQGVGKGIQRRDCNPYAADTDEHAAWKLGYEEGLDKPMPAQDVNAELVELREWRDKAFEAHPNLDLDIDALSKYKGAK